jgi:glycopeptide antibiotics resistance protein
MKLRNLYIIPVIVFVTCILFFSWLPHPSFRNLPFFPNWLANWTDKYGNLRTAIPFVPLSFFLKITIQKSYGITLSLCLFLATVAELGQILLPFRSFDFGDILFALIGCIVGLFFFFLFDFCRKKSTSL